MARGSVKRPILLYSLVFALALAFTVATLANLSLLRGGHGVYREAVTNELRALASRPTSLAELRAVVREHRHGGFELEVATATQSAFGLSVQEIRRALRSDSGEGRSLLAIPTRVEDRELWLVARIDPTEYLTIVQNEIRRLTVAAILSSLALALLLSFLLSRLVLAPLTALQKVAGDSKLIAQGGATGGLARAGLAPAETPNEIADVAQTFRRTLRELDAERAELERKNLELHQMQESLIRAEKLASVGRLAAGIAHEIGNPLAAVLGYLSLLKGGALEGEQQREVVERCMVQLNRIHDTIRKLLTYARQDDSSEPVEPLSLSASLRDTLVLLRGHPSMKGVEVDDRVPVSDTPDALGRAGPFNQVLVNLLINAAQAMEGVEEPRIALERIEAGEKVGLAISDTGPGVPSAKLDQIFDPFFTTKPPGEGTGLGLAVSRSLMEAMGGEVRAEPAPGGGARFTVLLRRSPPRLDLEPEPR